MSWCTVSLTVACGLSSAVAAWLRYPRSTLRATNKAPKTAAETSNGALQRQIMVRLITFSQEATDRLVSHSRYPTPSKSATGNHQGCFPVDLGEAAKSGYVSSALNGRRRQT